MGGGAAASFRGHGCVWSLSVQGAPARLRRGGQALWSRLRREKWNAAVAMRRDLQEARRSVHAESALRTREHSFVFVCAVSLRCRRAPTVSRRAELRRAADGAVGRALPV